MIVCLCRSVCERRIREVIAEGAECVDDVTAACGAGGDCGACRPTIAVLIDEARAPIYTYGDVVHYATAGERA